MEGNERKRDLNNLLKKSGIDGIVFLSNRIMGAEEDDHFIAYNQFSLFGQFTENNDQHIDTGAFDFQGHTYFWKIDYVNISQNAGSNMPSDTDQIIKILTFMQAHEY